MEYFFQAWQTFVDDFRAASHLLLLSDYDGTLTPIVSRPEEALLSPEMREKLSTLARKPAFTVGIISGRSLAETVSMVAIEGIYYAGNHGLEIEGPGISYINPQAETARAVINDLAGRFAEALASVDGVIIQDKGLSLSVHYRLVKPEEEDSVAATVDRLAQPLRDSGEVRVFAGKKVWEIRPPIDWDKGKAVQTVSQRIATLRRVKRLLTVYLGDDTTDEDAFRVLHRPDGWSIFVGRENSASAADYYLASTSEVENFLSRLIALK